MRAIKFTLGIILYIYTASCQSTEPLKVSKDDPYTKVAEPSMVHGFTLFGAGHLYASHKPRYSTTLNYQLILEINLDHRQLDAKSLYELDGPRTQTPRYTLKPEPFALEELTTLKRNWPLRTTFRATLFRGAFWDQGKVVLHDVQVKVRRIVLQNRFAEDSAPLPYLMYYVFGNDRELYAAHLINEYPDFDHLTKVRIKEGVYNASQSRDIQRGRLVVFPDLMNAFPNALRQGEVLRSRVQMENGYLPVKMAVDDGLFFERVSLY